MDAHPGRPGGRPRPADGPGPAPAGAALIVHSDRGTQFASAEFGSALAAHRLTASMSRKGNCCDNAFIESFWSSLKYETVYRYRYATRAAARAVLFDYIETFYNRVPAPLEPRLRQSRYLRKPTKQYKITLNSLSEK
jgi:transposase InsO family protein